MFVVYLILTKKVNHQMTQYQIFRITLIELSNLSILKNKHL